MSQPVVPKITPNEIDKTGPFLGGGTFGEVWKGRCRGVDVAVKYLKSFDSSKIDEFMVEVEVQANVLHPNIVLLLGACTQGNNWAMVTEFCARGDLNSILHKPENANLPISSKIQFALDIASGMSWLSGENVKILHRDLKPANVLVDQNWTCKVADFGLSQLKTKDIVRGDDDGAGSPLWMSPEALLGEEVTVKNDVYAYGLVLWEILTQENLFTEYSDLEEFTEDIAEKGVRPAIPETVPHELASIVKMCWDHDPNKRPSFIEVINLLQKAHISIHLPKALCPDAPKFWSKNWSSQWKVPYSKWFEQLHKYLFKKSSKSHIGYKCIDAILFEPDVREQDKEMTLLKFSSLLKWFGPLKSTPYTILDKIEALTKEKWFFGQLSSKEAERKLEPHTKAREGVFLMRLNPGTNEPIEKTPYTISRIDANGSPVHTRVYPSKKGGYYIKIDEKQIREDGDVSGLILAIKSKQPKACLDPCAGHPFADLFSTTKKGSPVYIAVHESDGEEDSD